MSYSVNVSNVLTSLVKQWAIQPRLCDLRYGFRSPCNRWTHLRNHTVILDNTKLIFI